MRDDYAVSGDIVKELCLCQEIGDNIVRNRRRGRGIATIDGCMIMLF